MFAGWRYVCRSAQPEAARCTTGPTVGIVFVCTWLHITEWGVKLEISREIPCPSTHGACGHVLGCMLTLPIRLSFILIQTYMYRLGISWINPTPLSHSIHMASNQGVYHTMPNKCTELGGKSLTLILDWFQWNPRYEYRSTLASSPESFTKIMYIKYLLRDSQWNSKVGGCVYLSRHIFSTLYGTQIIHTFL